MAVLGTFDKQPGEKLDYDIDFSEWIPRGDTIISNTVSVNIAQDNALTVTTPGTILTGGKIIKVWVDDGTTGKTYQVQVSATTTGGRIKEAEFKVRVREV